MLSSCYKMIFGLLTKPATWSLFFIDQKGTSRNKACQWCNCTYGWAENGSKDTFGRSHQEDMGQGPSPSRSDIQVSFHWQKNAAVAAGLGVSDVAQVLAGIIHSRRQGKHWESEGAPPCSFEMPLGQCQGTADSPVAWEVEQRIPRGKWETAANKTFKDNICCKTPTVKTIKSQDCFKQFQL